MICHRSGAAFRHISYLPAHSNCGGPERCFRKRATFFRVAAAWRKGNVIYPAGNRRRAAADRRHSPGDKDRHAVDRCNERTVKNWFRCEGGPRGEHSSPSRHSNEALEAFLPLAGRQQLIAAKKLMDARNNVAEMLALINSLTANRRPDRAYNDIRLDRCDGAIVSVHS